MLNEDGYLRKFRISVHLGQLFKEKSISIRFSVTDNSLDFLHLIPTLEKPNDGFSSNFPSFCESVSQ